MNQDFELQTDRLTPLQIPLGKTIANNTQVATELINYSIETDGSINGKFTDGTSRLLYVAPLGILFYDGTLFPDEYKGQAFIAEHGSWNRSQKSGYRVTLVRMEHGKAAGYEVFAEGWLQDEEASGRPVDLLVIGDGSLLLSDDQNGVIYRISYTRPMDEGVALRLEQSGQSYPDP